MLLQASMNVRLLGDPGTGKTTMLRHFVGKNLIDNSGTHSPDGTRVLVMTYVSNISDKNIHINNPQPDIENNTPTTKVEQLINIWDTPKHLERWDDSEATIPPRDLDAILIFYDVTNPTSFKNIQTKWIPWIKQTREEDDINDCCRPDLVIFLVANKSDNPPHPALNSNIVKSFVDDLNNRKEFGFVGLIETCSLQDHRNRFSSTTTMSSSDLSDDSVVKLFRVMAQAVYEQRKKILREHVANAAKHTPSSLLYGGATDEDESKLGFSENVGFWKNLCQTILSRCVIL